mmetsp:Transcript_14805/g.34152  ORF Transcript_14805/g.34152 Transcript_14805/m.34152 type:complete len:327 (-) Transcript_14805:88-1068(-)
MGTRRATSTSGVTTPPSSTWPCISSASTSRFPTSIRSSCSPLRQHCTPLRALTPHTTYTTYMYLTLQVASNFCLLVCLDKRFMTVVRPLLDDATFALVESTHALSLVTAISWSTVLMQSPAPASCRLLSAAVIFAAHFGAPHLPSDPAFIEYSSYALFLALLLLCQPTNKLTYAYGAGFGAWFFGCFHLSKLAGGMYEDQAATVAAAEMSALFLLAFLSMDPVKKIAFFGAISLKVCFVLTGQRDFAYMSFAFLAMLWQGVSHIITKQQATLMALNKDKSSNKSPDEAQREKVAFEWSHVSYFPVLLVHSCHASLAGRAYLASKEA